ncbi:glycosyl transferase, group 1 [Methanococcus maripaludis C5]|uniref:Glycosyl transferase, group 1 n=1 Tax=Methanococcus maripaludis (strain C5 / ATCC BAA-1333) TaxID=402880 RepID=A4FZH1_METM5|nr:glycosyltransferase [Methanococcus maripaludis]ABO35605.1 glycosyl transferase, group 1 [Methanococcus maripaludis C5]
MKILFICGAKATYTRNSVIYKGLKENNVEIIDCTSIKSTYAKRYIEVALKFLTNMNKKYDVVFVGFLGQPLVPIIKILTKKPIFFDAFISIYDTLCDDRKIFKPSSFCGQVSYFFDKISCKISDVVFLDTKSHVDYFLNTFNLQNSNFERIFVGADDEIFYPRNTLNKNNDEFTVFYYGTFLPLQGIDIILHSAKILENYSDIKFKIVGIGLEHSKIIKLAKELNLKNIEFIDWIEYEKLPLEIANSDVCLGGHFGTVAKGQRVISGKTFQFLSMNRAVIVGNNLANSELLVDKKNALFVDPNDPKDLANNILLLRNNPEIKENIAKQGYLTFKEHCTPKKIGKDLKNIIEKKLGKL